jgi:hypothetical protein
MTYRLRWVHAAWCGAAWLAFVACGDDSSSSAGRQDAGADTSVSSTDSGGDAGAPNPLGEVFVQNAGVVTSIVTDAAYIYWTSGTSGKNDGVVQRAPLNGQGMATTFAMGQAGPGAISVDANNVYWINLDTNEVDSAPLVGGLKQILVPGTGKGSFAGGTTTDATFLYYTTNGDVSRVPIAGGPAQLIASTGLGASVGVGVTSTSVVWTSFTQNGWKGPVSIVALPVYSDAGTGSGGDASDVDASDVDGGLEGGVADAGPPPSVPMGTALASAQNEPSGLVLDSVNAYFANQGTVPTFLDGQIVKVSLDADGGAMNVVALASMVPNPVAVAIDADNVYFTCRPASGPAPGVMRVPLGGGDAAYVAKADGMTVSDAIGLDRTSVYWSSNGVIYKTPK